MISSLFHLHHLLIAPSTFHTLSRTATKSNHRFFHLFTSKSMSINLQFHAFAGNPIRSKTQKQTDPLSSFSSLEILKTILHNINDGATHYQSPINVKVLPFRKGRPLASTTTSPAESVPPVWHLGWMSLVDCKAILDSSEVSMNADEFVYLGSRSMDDEVYWAIDVSGDDGLVNEFGKRQFCFVELRTLMVATDWGDTLAMGDLAVAGHARALLEWHTVSRYCGSCGERTVSMEGGRRKQCPNDLCKKRIYPRTDPVVIMLVIDKVNDRVLLSRQSRFVPRMWSCLAGFIEPGESLEEAVRRETWEETGIEVGEVTYHSSQPWPVGPSNMPCQLMVGFFAYAASLEINVDKEELEDAQWYSREEVKQALTFAEYEKAQRTSVDKVDQMCKGVEKSHNLAADYNVESGELTPMFVPGPFAIAHHLISSWVSQGSPNEGEDQSRKGSLSNL